MNGVSDQERQSVMSSAESQSSQWTRGRRLMVSLPIFIILLGHSGVGIQFDGIVMEVRANRSNHRNVIIRHGSDLR